MQLLKPILFSIFLLLNASAFAALSEAEVACNKLLNNGEYEKALTQAKDLLDKDDKNENAWLCQGRALVMTNKSVEAIHAFDQAEKVATDDYEKAFAKLLAGHTFIKMQQPKQAITSYQASLDYAKQTKVQGLVLSNHMNIGNVYFDLGDFKQALQAFQQANDLAMNDNERGETYEKIAKTYYALDKFDLALENQIKAQIKMEKVGSLDQYAESTIMLGECYLAVNNLSNAELKLNSIIDFAKKQGGAYYEAKGSYVLAKVKAAQKDNKAAKLLIQHAKEIAAETNDHALSNEIKEAEKQI